MHSCKKQAGTRNRFLVPPLFFWAAIFNDSGFLTYTGAATHSDNLTGSWIKSVCIVRTFSKCYCSICHENAHDACGHRHNEWKFSGHFHLKLNKTMVVYGFYVRLSLCDEPRLPWRGAPAADQEREPGKIDDNLPAPPCPGGTLKRGALVCNVHASGVNLVGSCPFFYQVFRLNPNSGLWFKNDYILFLSGAAYSLYAGMGITNARWEQAGKNRGTTLR